MENVLCIGGPMDGQWISIQDGVQYFYAYEKADAPPSPNINETTVTPKKIEYCADTLRDKDGRGYVVMSCNGENIIERLLNRYAPNAEVRGRPPTETTNGDKNHD